MKGFHLHKGVQGALSAIGLSLCAVLPALADEYRAARVPPMPLYQQECASCHIAYPPGMLPAASWQSIMGNLDRHYGTDASLDPASVKQITTWLTMHAGTYKRVSANPPEERITRSAWFIREHDEVPASTWKRAAVKSPANCAACHPRADQGEFNEHDVRIPR